MRFGLTSRLFKDIELFQRRSPRNAGVGEDGKIGLDVSFAHRAEDFPLIVGDVVPTPDFSEHTHRVCVHLFNESLNDLLLAPGMNLRGIKGLCIESGAGDDRHARLHRELPQEVKIPPHVWMSTIHQAGDAVFSCCGDLFDHEIEVLHEIL